jgi:CheY-like chemotaxis protein
MAKILLVDDDRDLAGLTKTILAKKGHEVFVAHDAHRGIEQAIKQKPDLIFMDIMLPEVSGAEAVKRLKRIPDLAAIPVVFLTALISTEEESLEETGITIDGLNYRTLGKPYEIDGLLNMVENILKAKNE